MYLIVRNPIYIISLISFIVFSLQSNPGFPLVTTFLDIALSSLSRASDWISTPPPMRCYWKWFVVDDVLLDVFLITAARIRNTSLEPVIYAYFWLAIQFCTDNNAGNQSLQSVVGGPLSLWAVILQSAPAHLRTKEKLHAGILHTPRQPMWQTPTWQLCFLKWIFFCFFFVF